MTVLLKNAMSTATPGPAFWSIATAAERWSVNVRPKLLSLVESLDDDSGDTLESLCFVVDEVLRESKSGLTEYQAALTEISGVLLGCIADPAVQLLVTAEVQKTALTC